MFTLPILLLVVFLPLVTAALAVTAASESHVAIRASGPTDSERGHAVR